MIVIRCEQGTPEWHAARAGVVTASAFDKIMTTSLKASSQAHSYLCRLVEETVWGPQVEADDDNAFMERGRELEPEARAWYACDRDVDVAQVGMILRDDRRVGCSPDGLVGDALGLEIKCPLRRNHLGYLIDPSTLVAKYRAQIQLSLLVSGLPHWDIESYCPGLPPVVVRCEPDAAWRKAAEPLLSDFIVRLDVALAELYACGVTPPSMNPFA